MPNVGLIACYIFYFLDIDLGVRGRVLPSAC